MCWAISRGQWQPQTAVLPLLGPTMQHVKAVGLMNREEENPRLKNPILPRCVESSLSGPVPQNTCGSCWLGTAQQFYLNMRGEGGSRVTSKSKGHTYTNQRPGHYLTHEHSHITRVVAAMDTCFDLTGAHQYGIAVDQWPRRTRVFFFCFEAGIHAECNAKSPI